MSAFQINFCRGGQAICILSEKGKIPSILEITDRKKEKTSKEIKLIDILGKKEEKTPHILIM